MVQFLFDYFDKFEIPNISLANPDLSLLYNLGTIYDRELKLRYNALSEFSFTADKYQDGILNDYYELLDYRRVIVIDGIGNFMIVSKKQIGDGINQKKIIGCESIETELNFKKLTVFKGQYKFWDLFNPAPTLLGTIINYLPGWTIANVDASLISLDRRFDISDTTIYSFLMNDVSQTYQCIFSFDSINKTITAHDIANATTNSDIFLSYNNLVENTNITEITDELVTALNVYGGGNLDIRDVNPLGTNTIYDFSYYKTTEWMSQGLIDALNLWEAKIISNQSLYATLLTEAETLNALKLDYLAQIETLKSSPMAGETPDSNTGLDVLRELQTVKIRQGLPIDAINALIIAKENEIFAVNDQIGILDLQINSNALARQSINTDLSWDVNFSDAQQIELSRFIIGSTYTNPNIIKTDESTLVEIQQYSQTLYNQAILILAKVSEPRYMFDVDSVNFVFLKEFQTFINQLNLGVVVTVEFDDGQYAYPALLGIDLNYDEPEKFKLTFSNRLRLDDSAFQFSDLFNQSINSGISTSFNSEMWSSWDTYSKDSVSTFITSALDASKNAVINATNQEIIIDGTGIRGRYLDPNTGAYDPRQFWMINNMLVFTNNNWNNAALAIGQITNPTGGSSYGIVGDLIVGRLVASNELWVENESNTFSVNGSGATLINADLTIYKENAAKLVLSPDTGISISKSNGLGGWDRKFYVDEDGNVIFAGDLSGASGTFTGTIIAKSGKIGTWTIDNWGLKDDFGNYIYGDGRVRLGMLTIDGSEAWFDGNIYARNLQDLVNGTQIEDIIANTITTGTLSAIDIFGCRIMWPGVIMQSLVPGVSSIIGDSAINMYSGNSQIFVTPINAGITAPSIQIGQIIDPGITTIIGSIRTIDSSFRSGTGISGTFII